LREEKKGGRASPSAGRKKKKIAGGEKGETTFYIRRKGERERGKNFQLPKGRKKGVKAWKRKPLRKKEREGGKDLKKLHLLEDKKRRILGKKGRKKLRKQNVAFIHSKGEGKRKGRDSSFPY